MNTRPPGCGENVGGERTGCQTASQALIETEHGLRRLVVSGTTAVAGPPHPARCRASATTLPSRTGRASQTGRAVPKAAATGRMSRAPTATRSGSRLTGSTSASIVVPIGR
ncbi:MAG: hypothetical protein M9930_19945 [Anaerolineae bacterium]|nr:hypothetical protein [Anaerolineae bacterium]